MKVYIFSDKRALARTGGTAGDLERMLEELALDTDTSDLVAAIYLFSGQSVWEAHAVGEVIGPERFARERGYWRFIVQSGTPEDLPERFYLVRIALGLRRRYPATETDIYNWEMTFEDFRDHLAYTFAHELHHFRRDHLGLHAGEGEHSAIKWAIDRVQRAGFNVGGIRLPTRRRRKGKKRLLRLPLELRPELLRRVKLSASHLSREDLRELDRWIRSRLLTVGRQTRDGRLREHAERLRVLPDGTPLLVVHDDDPDGYTGQTAVKVRNLRRNSKRMVIRTADGEEWHYLMEWLAPVPDEDARRSRRRPVRRDSGSP